MNSQTKKHFAAILVGFSITFFFGACGPETEENLDEVSDSAKENKNNLLDGRGKTPPPPKADDKKTPPEKTKKDPTKPEIEKREETPKPTEPEVEKGGCGDGKRKVEAEECDDGNRVNGDGCNSNCRSEAKIMASARTTLDVGYGHVCMIDSKTIQLKCWGLNDFGQLGQGNTAEIGDGVGVAVSTSGAVNIGSGMSTELVAAGGDSESASTCIINNKNEVKCFGDNAFGQLGQGSTSDLGDSPSELGSDLNIVDLGAGNTATDIDSGARHQCALIDNGDVKCWGHNDAGQLGQGHTNTLGDDANEMGHSLSPIPLGADVEALAVGGKHSCVITVNREVKCWGLNDKGQLGQDNTLNIGDEPEEMAALGAVNLGPGRKAKAIAAGTNHSCALLDNATVKCWGLNSSGQLGQDSTLSLGDELGEMATILPVNLGNGRAATAIAAGENYTCALLDNKSIKCWGENSAGQLGQNSLTNLGDEVGEMAALSGIELGDGRKGAIIAAGGNTTCALLDDQSLKCWGKNTFGQLGQGNTTDIGDAAGEMKSLVPIKTGF
jgi:cysteine-rich repeat protein